MIEKVVLEDGNNLVIVSMSCAINTVRESLITELLACEWDRADLSYEAMKLLILKDSGQLMESQNTPSKPPKPVKRPTNPSI